MCQSQMLEREGRDQHNIASDEGSDAMSENPTMLALLEQLGDQNADVQQQAAISLIEQNKFALPLVTRALRSSSNAQVRYLCAWILGQIRDTRSVPALIEALSDEDERVQDWAAKALGELGDSRAVVALEALLRRHPRPETRLHAVLALGWIGGATTTPALITALADEESEVQLAAAEFLAQRGDKHALSVLMHLAKLPSEWLRGRAIHALAQLADEQAFDTLYAALNDPAEWVRHHAALGLGMLKAQRACADLMYMLLYDSSPQVRRAAAIALGEIGEFVAIETLVSALADPNDHVREAVDAALLKLGYGVD